MDSGNLKGMLLITWQPDKNTAGCPKSRKREFRKSSFPGSVFVVHLTCSGSSLLALTLHGSDSSGARLNFQSW